MSSLRTRELWWLLENVYALIKEKKFKMTNNISTCFLPQTVTVLNNGDKNRVPNS